jgi:hypothetical protein
LALRISEKPAAVILAKATLRIGANTAIFRVLQKQKPIPMKGKHNSIYAEMLFLLGGYPSLAGSLL